MTKHTLYLRAEVMEKLIAAHDLRLTSAARRIGCTRQTLSRALDGHPISADAAASCAAAFSTSLDTLFEVRPRDAHGVA